jgi:acyl-CoA thioester hydrolase
MESGIDFALLYVSCEYKSMARFGETVEIHMSVAHIDRLRMTITYKVLDSASGKLRAAGESRHCYYHNKKKRPVSLEKELPELYRMIYECKL